MNDINLSAASAEGLGISDAEEGATVTLTCTVKSCDDAGDCVLTPTSATVEGGEEGGGEGGEGGEGGAGAGGDEGGSAEEAPSPPSGKGMKPAIALVLSRGKRK